MNIGSGGIGRMDDPEDRLPWLESADDDYREGPSALRVIAIVAGALALVALAVWGFTAWRPASRLAGSGALIEPPAGDYKVKPEEPGGMKVDGEGDTVFSTSEGGGPDGAIDTRAVPEAPVAGRTVAAPRKDDKGSSKVVTAVPAAAGKLTAQSPQVATARIATSGGGGAVVQLGSFPNEAGASLAWNALSKRFAYLAPLGKSVEKADVNGNTVYRLRVNAGSNGAASTLCGKLKVAGEACFIPN